MVVRTVARRDMVRVMADGARERFDAWRKWTREDRRAIKARAQATGWMTTAVVIARDMSCA